MIKFHSACRMTLVTAELPGSDPGVPLCTPIHQVSLVQRTAKTFHFPSPFHLPQRPAQPPPTCQWDRKCWHQCPRLRFPGAGGENLRKRRISKWKTAHRETWMKCFSCCFCCSVAKSCPILCDPHGQQHPRLLCPSLSTGICSNSCPPSQWCHPTISSFNAPLSFCLQSLPASETFPMSQLFTSGGQSIGASASASVLSVTIQGWFPLGWIGWISLQSKRLSRVFSNTTVQKYQFFSAQPSLWSNSNIRTWLLEKAQLWLYRPICFKSGEMHTKVHIVMNSMTSRLCKLRCETCVKVGHYIYIKFA